MKNICVIGLGYVGLTFSIHAASRGFMVSGVEVNDDTLSSVLSGKAHFYEPGINPLIKENLKNNFNVSKQVDKNEKYDFVIISVGTPLNPIDNSPDYDFLLSAVNSVLKSINSSSVIILRSTVSVGTTRKIKEHIEKHTKIKDIHIGFCPERTIEGKALEELSLLPQIISADSEKTLQIIKEFFKPLVNECVETNSLEEAELVKLYNNTFRDSLFAISNIFSMIGQEFSLDAEHAIEIANYKYPRSFIPKPGFVSGPCLEKDAYILSHTMVESTLKDFFLAPRKANELLETKFCKTIKKIIIKNPSHKILFSGIAFKGEPKTNDLRGSSAIKVLKELKKYHKQIRVHDFMNDKKSLKDFTGIKSLESNFYLSENFYRFDKIFIFNNHSDYKSEEFTKYIKNQFEKNTIIIDMWNVLGLKSDHIISLGQFLMEDD